MNKKNFNERTGALIAFYRKINKLTQDKLAEILSISKIKQSRVETGKTKIEAYSLIIYAKALKIPIEEFFKDVSKQDS
ncbi:MAG: helix-turn-helix transcriptional regulator [Bdellovibrionales bacterium]|nr:helix-turn-helix transcriptional regulator [Bdellovibrionales bacterium]